MVGADSGRGGSGGVGGDFNGPATDVLGDRVSGVTLPRCIETWWEGDMVRSLVEEERVVLKRVREVFAQSNVVHIPSLKAKDRKLVC